MRLSLFWLIFDLLAWYRLAQMYPTHRTTISWVLGPLVAAQLFQLLHSTYAEHLSRVRANLTQRELDDAAEERDRAFDDNRPLSRYAGLSPKKPSEMSRDELIEYVRQLHGRPKVNPTLEAPQDG